MADNSISSPALDKAKRFLGKMFQRKGIKVEGPKPNFEASSSPCFDLIAPVLELKPIQVIPLEQRSFEPTFPEPEIYEEEEKEESIEIVGEPKEDDQSCRRRSSRFRKVVNDEQKNENANSEEPESKREKEKKKEKRTRAEKKISEESILTEVFRTDSSPKPKSEKRKKEKSTKLASKSKKTRKEEGTNSAPSPSIDSMRNRDVLRRKIVDNGWLSKNGLERLVALLKFQKRGALLKKKGSVLSCAIRTFYGNLKKEKDGPLCLVSQVSGVETRLDGKNLGEILEIPYKGFKTYAKGIWPKSKFCNPFVAAQRFAHDQAIPIARRVKTMEMRPFTKFLHLFVLKKTATVAANVPDTEGADPLSAALTVIERLKKELAQERAANQYLKEDVDTLEQHLHHADDSSTTAPQTSPSAPA
ncbi:hypothetical protein Dimus_011122 [Dionaea muscipula]